MMDVMYAMQVMQAMGVDPAAMGGGKKGKGKGGKGKKQQQFGGKKKKGGATLALPWKSRLNNAYSKEHKVPVPKDSIVYTTLESDEKKFMCTLTCDKFSSEYTTDEAFDSKKEAEEAVAEAAIKGEFAEIYEAGPAPPKKKQAPPAKKQKIAQAPPAKKQKVVQADLPWKSRIVNAYSQEHKTCTTKDTFTYTTLQSEGGSYMSTLTCEKFAAEYTSDELYESKKIAEEAVAMAALKGEFPAAYASVPAAMKKAGAKGGAGVKGEVKKAAAGVKRKAADSDAPKENLCGDAKSRLNNCCMVLAERAMTKNDVVYDVTESNGNSVATLTLNCFEGKKPVFKSKPATGTSKDSKKQAQNDAAEKALKAYKAELDAKLPEHEAKKAAKKAEHEAKVAAKKAAEA